MQIYDIQDDVVDVSADGLLIKTAQEIPDDYVSWLKQKKIESKMQREGLFMHVAELPVGIVHRYLTEGFDVFKEPIRETVKRLYRDGLDAFVVTNKRV